MTLSPSAATLPAPPKRGRAAILIFLLLCMALALRIWMIAEDGLWLDEGYSVWLAELPFSQMIERIVTTDQHPPLYYALLWLWRWGGDGESYLRLLSTVFGILTIPAIYLLGRRLLGTPAGLVAALLLTVSPFNIRYAQEVRMYALLMLLATLALLCLAGWLTVTQSEYAKFGLTQKRQVAKGWWIAGYVVYTWLMLLTHNTALFLPFAANVFVVGWWLYGRWRPYNPRTDAHAVASPNGTKFRRPAMRAWFVAQGALLVLWLPWAPAFLHQSAQVYASFWISAPTPGRVLSALASLFSAYLPHLALWPVALLLIVSASLLLGVVALRRAPTLLAFLLILGLTPLAGELLVSLRRPIFAERTLIWVAIPLWLIMAAGLTRVRPRLLGGVLLAALVTINLASVHNYYATFQREGWREAAAHLAQAAEPGDLVIFHSPWVQLPFAYYLRRARTDLVLQGAPLPMLDDNYLERLVTAAQLPNIDKIIDNRQRVWLVYSHFWYSDPKRLTPQQIMQTLPKCSQDQFLWDIEVWLCTQE